MHGPGAYLYACVTSSLTTSCTMPMARVETGILLLPDDDPILTGTGHAQR
jgi:hypothetical protein